MIGIEDTFRELDKIESEFDELWKTYDPNASSCNLNILFTKLCTLGYEYVATSYEIIRREQNEINIGKAKKCLTYLSYGLSGLAAITVPPLFVVGFAGSLYLSYKRRMDAYYSTEYMTDDERSNLLDLLQKFDKKCSNSVDTIEERYTFLDSDVALEELKNENIREYNKRIASKLLIDLIYKGEIEIPNDDVKLNMIHILQEELNTDETDYQTLITNYCTNFFDLLNANTRVSERARKLARQKKSEFYQ